ncbi:cellulose-binding protein [Aspergillus flavus]|nr:cellulose-binding protein [Aspergillus flavus]RAQ79279.1 cellulose-binding protein [Aspergillus flavus]
MAQTERLQTFASKPRVFILSDISNEPDDAESLVRYLLYSNQFQTEGLVACTSTWMKTKVCPQDMHKIIDGYEKVVDNLNAHAHPQDPYPTAAYMRSLIKKGAETYGMSAVGDDIPLSEGGQLLLERIEADSTEPLWVLCWGGTNVLASVLLKIQNTKSEAVAAALRSKLRVYTISDQDDTGVWIRHRYPDIFYICSVHGWNMYGMAAWCGISGDGWYGFDKGGPDPSKISKEWIRENIQIGPLGSTYPDYMFIPEGDTPTFLYLIQNGLGVPERPGWGSWGGRYIATDISAKGLRNGHYSDTVDEAVGLDGKTHKSNHATIWRWRDAFQNDFAARMQWTLSPELSKANHQPVIILNGSKGLEPLHFELEAGSTFELNASETYDPDTNDSLTFTWYQYKDPSATQWSVHHEVGQLQFEPLNSTGSKVKVTVPPPEKCCLELISREALPRGQLLHIVLEVKDNGTPPLTSYRRVTVQTLNEKLLGGGGGAEAIGDVMRDMM